MNHLREAFFVFASLTVIALFNAGQLWEGRKISMEYMNFQLTEMLQLEKSQLEKIHSINAKYEIEISKISTENVYARDEEISRLLCERNKKVREVLNEQQQKMINTYCTDLISFSRMFE